MTRKIIIQILFAFFAITNVNGQTINKCRYPINVSADSLFRFALERYKAFYNAPLSPPMIENLRNYNFDSNDSINLDSAYRICQKDLMSKLGEYVYCNFINMEVGSFSRRDGKPGSHRLSFYLELPNLINKHSAGYTNFQYESIAINYMIQFEDKVNFKITYPTNIPDCNGTNDCGFTVTKEKALAIAKKIKFLKETDKYSIITEGSKWTIAKLSDCISLGSITIDLKTGEHPEWPYKISKEDRMRQRKQLKESIRSVRLSEKNLAVYNKAALAKANRFITERIKDKDILKNIKQDTSLALVPEMVVFRVINDSNLNDRNQFVIHFKRGNSYLSIWSKHFDENCSIDTIRTNFNVTQIINHIKNPTQYPLDISKDGVKKIALTKGLEKGIKPWRIVLGDCADCGDGLHWYVECVLGDNGCGYTNGHGFGIRTNGDTNNPRFGTIVEWRSMP